MGPNPKPCAGTWCRIHVVKAVRDALAHVVRIGGLRRCVASQKASLDARPPVESERVSVGLIRSLLKQLEYFTPPTRVLTAFDREASRSETETGGGGWRAERGEYSKNVEAVEGLGAYHSKEFLRKRTISKRELCNNRSGITGGLFRRRGGSSHHQHTHAHTHTHTHTHYSDCNKRALPRIKTLAMGQTPLTPGSTPSSPWRGIRRP